jgi:queuine/archaeosine tRNA-ribosyltransferase
MGELLKTLKEQNSSELITKWENIGFLSNTKNKRNSALACEFSALYLLDNIEKYNGDITTLTHPVIVRIFRKIEEDLPTQLIFDKVVEIITTFKIKLDGMKKTDEWINRGENKVKEVEAEFIADFSDNFPFKFGPARG